MKYAFKLFSLNVIMNKKCFIFKRLAYQELVNIFFKKTNYYFLINIKLF